MKRKIYLLVLTIICIFIFTGCNSGELVKDVDYYVRGEFTGKYLDTKKRGYYIDTLNQPNAPYFYIICMGEKNTGGYDLKIKEVNKLEDKTEIIVEEIEPDAGDIVTMAFTSPTVIVEFPEYQENIVIKNTKGDIFNKLN